MDELVIIIGKGEEKKDGLGRGIFRIYPRACFPEEEIKIEKIEEKADELMRELDKIAGREK